MQNLIIVTPERESTLLTAYSDYMYAGIYDPEIKVFTWLKLYGKSSYQAEQTAYLSHFLTSQGKIMSLMHPDDLQRFFFEASPLLLEGKSFSGIYRISLRKPGLFHYTYLNFHEIIQADASGIVRPHLFGTLIEVEDIVMKTGLIRQIERQASILKRKQLLNGLSNNEVEVLGMTGEGKLDKEIADAMNLSIPSIVQYRRKLLRHYNVRTKLDLVRIAFRSGLIS